MKKIKLDVKNSSVNISGPGGYQWAANPNKKAKNLKSNVKKQVIKKDKIEDKKISNTDKTVNTNKTVSNNTNKKNATNTNKELSFGEAYKKQREYNIKNKIAHYGDSKGYFTHKGKKYNTESKEEKTARLNANKPAKPNENASDAITKGKNLNNKAQHSKSQINRDKKFNNKYMRKGGQVRQTGGRVMGSGGWAGKAVPGMRYD